MLAHLTLRVTAILLAALVLYAAPNEAGAGAVLRHSLKLTVDFEKRLVAGTDEITVTDDAPRVDLLLRKGSSVDAAEANGGPVSYNTTPVKGRAYDHVRIELPPSTTPAKRTVRVTFHGSFTTIEDARKQITRGLAFINDGVIGPEGMILPSSSYWFPREAESATPVDAVVVSPEGYSAIMEGAYKGKRTSGGNSVSAWKADYPVNGVNLVAGRYKVDMKTRSGVELYTYFFKKDKKLSELYLERSAGYIDRYGAMFGPYPFGKFAVVESFLPTGYGMPSFTLLGSAVIRLPFIPYTSLGHEIAHSWWGNSVFVDESHGNWAEAITSQTADHLYARDKGPKKGREYRLKSLRGYKNFAGADAIALKDFTDPVDPAARAVGYNKGMMIFNMLEELLGEDVFRDGLKEFYKKNVFTKASWKDIERAFEAASGKDLGWFFDEWLTRSSGPELMLKAPEVKKAPGGYAVSFSIEQAGEPYTMYLPVAITTPSGTMTERIKIENGLDSFSFTVKVYPASVEVDPEYTNFRVLSSTEVPPELGACFGDAKGILVVPSRPPARDKYLRAARRLSKDYGLKLVSDTEAAAGIGDTTAFIFGGPGENTLFEYAYRGLSKQITVGKDAYRVGGKTYPRKTTLLAAAARNPEDPRRTLCVLVGEAGEGEMTAAAMRMRHYSQAGYLLLGPEQRPVVKGAFDAPNALIYRFKR